MMDDLPLDLVEEDVGYHPSLPITATYVSGL